MSYPFKEIESKWQEFWLKNKTFKTPEDTEKPKYYVLDMFPYPSGAGLHVGHPEGYTATDIMARYKRMKGFNVLHPMGWDAFGLPAERYAMQTKIHPEETTKKNVDNFRRQLQSIGFSYDWEREINTTSPDYYKWTQWIFLKIFNSYYDEKEEKAKPIEKLSIPAKLKKEGMEKEKEDYINSERLAYIAEMPVNWCPDLGTVLANEEVEEWVSKGHRVERRPMRQWMLRITKYAGRLLDDLKFVDWPQGTLELQKNWIGKSTGAQIAFSIKGEKTKSIEVFTTRPDTLFGVSYMVLAPEHPFVDILTSKENKKDVNEYIEKTKLKSDLERTVQGAKAEKTGVFTGGFVIHPFSGEEIPVWVADYVLMGYGTGAIMAVPAHDERDFEFAKKFNLPIKQVIAEEKNAAGGELEEAFTEEGFNINSDFLNGLPTEQAKEKMIERLEKEKIGTGKVNFKLRDWLFSRQRYWGEPIPVSFDNKGNYHFESDEDLPLLLPPGKDFHPTANGESPLANITEWVEFKKGKTSLRRETNTMPQWAGSSWYYLRFIDPANDKALVDPKKENYWMGDSGVDLYVGGAEHAVLHLLYARFWHKVLFDLGYVGSPEPFKKLVHQGIILGEDNQKMSKSRGNVVNPDDVLKEYGADSFRIYEMFLGPLEQMKPWSSRGIEGIHRFLDRVFRLYTTAKDDGSFALNPDLLKEPEADFQKDYERHIHFTIKKVTEDIERMSFNTAVSQLMIYINEVFAKKQTGRFAAESFLLLLSPFAPHMAEFLWELLGHKKSLAYENWPVFDPEKIAADEFEAVFQVNGKIRGKKNVPAGISEDDLKKEAVNDPGVIKFLEGKEPKKIIVVKGKLINIVV